jgi:hypothetical protein
VLLDGKAKHPTQVDGFRAGGRDAADIGVADRSQDTSVSTAHRSQDVKSEVERRGEGEFRLVSTRATPATPMRGTLPSY